jgi:hypothetical protein
MDYLDIALKARARMGVQDNPHDLIDRTLQEINKEWKPGALEWINVDRPDGWGKMLIILERTINEMALGGNLDGLRGALNSYRGVRGNLCHGEGI